MTQRNKYRPALELRRKRDAYQTLACLSALLLFFRLIAAISSRQAFGGHHALFRQSNRQSLDLGSEGSDENEVRTLEEGKPIKGELAVGQRNVYRISLGADQFLKVVVEQQGIDVVAQVVGPDGKGILMVDSESRPQGQEEVSVVAEAAGAFLLIVYPGQNETPSGSYEIRIEELRVATYTDHALHEARKQFEQALKLRAACEYGEALPFAERALEIRERLLGAEHHDVTAAIAGLAGIYTDKGEYVKAEPLYRRAMDIREKVLGKDHPDTTESLYELAKLYYRQGKKYVEAESLLKRALDINEKTWGQDHPHTADSLTHLAALYRAQGKYVEAESLLKRAFDINEKARGKDHPYTAASLDNLAVFYRAQGKYVEAESLLKRALDINEKALGAYHPSTAANLTRLAELYRKQEKYVEAESLLKRALDINEKAWGQDHPYTANSLDNLALLYQAKGDPVQAVVFQSRANTASERNLARNLVIGSERTKLVYLATLSAQTNRTISLHLRSAPNDPAAGALAATLILQRKGRALDATSQNLNALRSRFNTEDRALLDRLTKTRSQIARLALRGPQNMTIEQHQARIKALEDQAEEDEVDISRRSDEFRAQFLPVTLEDVQAAIPADAALVEFATYRPLNAKATKGEEYGQLHYVAYILRHNGEIQWKELGEAKTIDDSIAALRKALRNPNRSDVKRLARDVDGRVFQPIRPLLGEQTQLLISPDGQLNLIPIAALVDEQGRYLVERYSISYLTSGRDLLRLQMVIPADAALVEFATYRPLNAKATKGEEYGQLHYVAYILRHNGEIQRKELGEAKTIDDSIAALRKALRNPNRSDVKRLARDVDGRVFQPARSLIGEQTRLLISPDGQLNLVPFAALVNEQGRYLVERYSISYLASGRDLLRLQMARESKDGPMVVAAPDFGRRSRVEASRLGKQEKDASEGEVKGESAPSVIREFYFPPLPYAAQEGESLRALLPGSTLLTKGQATKAALSQAHRPLILHVATHGFFLEDLKLELPGGRGYQAFGEDPRQVLKQIEESAIRVESPLLRSGLALAGANEHMEEDNGILTALEVTGLNLWGTKLVVLSACDTGVGEVKNGDGVHGLRRALTLAGSETQVMSLWAVKDKATRDLMAAYYRKLKEGEGRGEALRQVQLEMLKQVRRRHPYYWASFIQSGEWANLDGRR